MTKRIIRTKGDWLGLADMIRSEGRKFGTVVEMSQYLGVPRPTLVSAIRRGDFPREFVMEEVEEEDPVPEKMDKPSVEYAGPNEAMIKFVSALPLSAEELMSVSGMDPEVWAIEKQESTAWQMGRSDKKKNLVYVVNHLIPIF